MVVRSQLGGLNDYLRTIKSIEIHRGYDKDIISIKSSLRDMYIDTERSVTSRSINGLKNAERKTTCNRTHTVERDRVVMHIGTESSKTIFLAAIIGVADYLEKNNISEFDGMEGYEVNHKDFSGNILLQGFGNNHIYNLEVVPEGLNTTHKLVEYRLHNMFGRYFGISALDEELMNKVRFGTDIDVRQYLMEIAEMTELDENGTPYIGKAGLELR